ncbi:helix-turn-helix domain-containing protein [Marinobacter salicampi]|uniref:helix-turn-helix domain-containing protein n=1 Tax=Marinobacter salicampi TaxID=435907 RepID=UPI00140B9D40|nr:helix-turn-helix transcriptional regulator [Marinobacter salicampi]
MRYMQSFNRHLKQLREARQLSRADVADICHVDEAQVANWEAFDPKHRRYPRIDHLMDICLRTETALDELLDFSDAADEGQLELPGLAFSSESDLAKPLAELEREIERFRETRKAEKRKKGDLRNAGPLSEEEAELLRRFRKTSAENRRMVLQILGH